MADYGNIGVGLLLYLWNWLCEKPENWIKQIQSPHLFYVKFLTVPKGDEGHKTFTEMKLITNDDFKRCESKISSMLAIVYDLDNENGVYYVLLDENEIENLKPTAISRFVQEQIGKPFSKSRVDYYAKDKSKNS